MALSRLLAPCLAVPLLVLAGCASGAGDAPPAGVDGLQIPTPSPDPDDFVAEVDNPWLPLEPGSVWVYETIGERPGTTTVTVTDETREVAGVATTVVREVTTTGRRESLSETWWAQDQEGNVWSFGEAGVWEAGIGGAEAGLAMPATPRVGDAFRQEYAVGVAQDQAEVVALDGTARVPLGAYKDLLVLEQRSDLQPGVVVRRYYARGTGLVQEETVTGGTDLSELVEVSGAA